METANVAEHNRYISDTVRRGVAWLGIALTAMAGMPQPAEAAPATSTKLVIDGAYSGDTPPAVVGEDPFGNDVIGVNETPPLVITYGNGRTGILMSSSNTVSCEFNGTLVEAAPIDCTGDASTPPHLVQESGMTAHTASTMPTIDLFRVNYNSAYSAETVTKEGVEYLETTNHDETKNDIEGDASGAISQPGTGNNYQTPIKKENEAWDPLTKTGCSENDVGTNTCQNVTIKWYSNASYSAFISSSIAKETSSNAWGEAATLRNQGPIIWPELGYGTNTRGLASFKYMGVRHPRELEVGKYFYVYYLDTSDSNTTTGDGSSPDTGIKVARSLVSSLGAMGSWRTYDYRTKKFDLPSIPRGMNQNNVADFLNVHGPAAKPLWPSRPQDGYVPVAFQVAQVAHDPHAFIGVENTVNNTTGKWQADLRFSPNLVNWSPPEPVAATAGPGNVNGESNGELFSELLSKNGKSNTDLEDSDPLQFYVESSINSVPYIQKVTIPDLPDKIPESPPCHQDHQRPGRSHVAAAQIACGGTVKTGPKGSPATRWHLTMMSSS